LFLFEKGNDSAIAPGTAFTVYAAADTQLDLEQLPKGAKLLRARPSGPENLTALGIVIDTNAANFFATMTGVVQGGAGDRAGLRIGYLITSINGVPTHNVQEASQAVTTLPPDTITMTLGYAFPGNLGYMPNEARVLLGKKKPRQTSWETFAAANAGDHLGETCALRTSLLLALGHRPSSANMPSASAARNVI
jgi:hypothetical protein